MKKKIVCLIIAVAVCIVCSSCSAGFIQNGIAMLSKGESRSVSPISDITEEIRGAWIASVYNINFPSKADLSESQLKAELDSIVESAASLGLNTIFFQVHPSADALYKSEFFPVSKYLYTDGVLQFDPLEYMIEKSHQNGILLHAWVNPLRVTVSKAVDRNAAISSLGDAGAAKTPDLLVYYADGKLYYNAGLPAVCDIVTECVAEIVSNYKVDGVVFDDYFYPYPANGASFDDADAYSEYGNGASLDDWRRGNINKIIESCYNEIKSINENCLFGVSPFGVWQNDNGTNGGSKTSGLEGYSALYCDSLTWANDGYVDYLSPQLYWQFESSSAPFDELCRWWNEKLDGTGCAFVPSLAAYRYDGDWENPSGEITKQLSLSRELITYRGAVLYGFAALNANSAGISDEVTSVFADAYSYYDFTGYPDKIYITSPKTGTVSETGTVTVEGVSDPGYSLTLNGNAVNRSAGGEFSVEYVLAEGENPLEFSCGGETYSLIIYR